MYHFCIVNYLFPVGQSVHAVFYDFFQFNQLIALHKQIVDTEFLFF